MQKCLLLVLEILCDGYVIERNNLKYKSLNNNKILCHGYVIERNNLNCAIVCKIFTTFCRIFIIK
jgi:hypothetical protein